MVKPFLQSKQSRTLHLLEYAQGNPYGYCTDLPTLDDIVGLLVLERGCFGGGGAMGKYSFGIENVFGLGGHQDHLPACLAHMLYYVVAEEKYILAYFFVKRIECAKATPNANLPYGMFLTRLYRHVMETYPHLDNGIYDVVEQVMRWYERITKKRTKNKAKTTKPDSEWKSCEGQSQSKAKDQKSQSQSQLNKLTVKTGAVIEEYYWLQSQPI
ncbi:hypothetical protein Tco_1429732 [Tanacetum coccineum]